MDGIRQYLLSIICACMIVAIIKVILGEKISASGILKLIAGIFIIFTVVAPVIKVEFEDFQNFYEDVSSDARDVVHQGEIIAQQTTQTIIKEKLEAYILDKATALNLDVDVCLTLKDAAVATPEEITIYGSVSPYGKKMLQAFLVEEMGIPEGKQSWR